MSFSRNIYDVQLIISIPQAEDQVIYEYNSNSLHFEHSFAIVPFSYIFISLPKIIFFQYAYTMRQPVHGKQKTLYIQSGMKTTSWTKPKTTQIWHIKP